MPRSRARYPFRVETSEAQAAYGGAKVQMDEWIAAQKADRALAAKRKRRTGILIALTGAVTMFGLGYLIGVEGNRALGLCAFVGLSGLATALVWGTWEIESEEDGR